MRVVRQHWVMFGIEIKDDALLVFTDREMATLRKASEILSKARDHVDNYYGADYSYDEWTELVCAESNLYEVVSSGIQREGWVDDNNKPHSRRIRRLGKWQKKSTALSK